ncbi:MAG: hypothetical protein QGG84_10515 [Rhodospirillales bacterium]|nr:hypothetical protein [Rhodospirillales bacterium]
MTKSDNSYIEAARDRVAAHNDRLYVERLGRCYRPGRDCFSSRLVSGTLDVEMGTLDIDRTAIVSPSGEIEIETGAWVPVWIFVDVDD